MPEASARLELAKTEFRRQAKELNDARLELAALQESVQQRVYNAYRSGIDRGISVATERLLARGDIVTVCPTCKAEVTVPNELLALSALTRAPTPCPPERIWYDLRNSVCGHKPIGYEDRGAPP